MADNGLRLRINQVAQAALNEQLLNLLWKDRPTVEVTVEQIESINFI